MKQFLFVLLAASLASSAVAQNRVRLDERATVLFPGKVEQMDSEAGLIRYSTLDRENKVTGMATVIDARQYGVDSAMIIANYHNPMFVDLILQGLLGQYPGVELISKRKIARGRFMGYELEFRNDRPDEKVPYRDLYAQVFFAGADIYALTVLAEDKATDTPLLKEKFFSSLDIQ